MPVPLPSRGLRYVISYVRETPTGLVLIDSGWNTEEGWRALVAGIGAIGATMSDVTGLIVTHVHPDHYGLARRVKSASGATVVLHEDDAVIAHQVDQGLQTFLVGYRDFLSQAGMPERELRHVNPDMLEATTFFDLMEPDQTVRNGEVLTGLDPDLQVVATPGHSPGHICLLDTRRRMLLSGDHLLPRVTPNVSVRPQQSVNPLRQYVDSLNASRLLEVDWVLPAHEWPFRDVQSRTAQILEHHRARLLETVELVGESPGATGWDIALATTWSRSFSDLEPVMRRAAVGEALAHLELLESEGLVTSARSHVVRWTLAKSPSAGLPVLSTIP